MPKTLMLIGAGIEQVPGIKLAKEMGLTVVATDMNREAPGFEFADDHIVASTYDVEKTVALASKYNKKNRIDGVMTVGADVPLTVAAVAHELGLPGISLETARLAGDKLAMKERFEQNGVPVPWFKEITILHELKEVVKDRGYPLVIKPVDSRGARGVLRVTESVDLGWAYETARAYSPNGRVMVEEFLPGPQVSTESIVYDGEVFTPGFADRNYEFSERFSPYIIENGGQHPSFLPSEQQEQICRLVAKAAKSMGIERGVAKGDIVVTEDSPKVIEIAARLSGGWFCTDIIPLSTGVNMVKTMMQISLGEEPDLDELLPKYHRGVALRYLFPPPGTVKTISGVETIEKIDWVKKMGIFLKPGDVIEPITDHTKRAGFVITIGETQEQAIERAQHAVQMINIEVDPVA